MANPRKIRAGAALLHVKTQAINVDLSRSESHSGSFLNIPVQVTGRVDRYAAEAGAPADCGLVRFVEVRLPWKDDDRPRFTNNPDCTWVAPNTLIEAGPHGGLFPLENEDPPIKTWELVINNIGAVYRGDDEAKARGEFDEYVQKSKEGEGRAAGEAVMLFCDDRLISEYAPPEQPTACNIVDEEG
jgi:hypothetical protein